MGADHQQILTIERLDIEVNKKWELINLGGDEE